MANVTQNKQALLAGLIIGGYDDRLGGQVYTVPLGGMLQRQPFSIGGTYSVVVRYANS